MKRYIARHMLMARLAALALIALYFLQAPVRAQGMTEVLVIFPSVGVAPDQRLSLTLFNPNGVPVRAQAQVHNSRGIVVGLGDDSVRSLSASIQAGAFHSFDIDQSGMHMPCFETTCRKQIYPTVRLSFSEATKPFVVSMKIIDVKDGTSNTVFVGEVLPSRDAANGNDYIISGFANDILEGIFPGQTMLVTLINPPVSEPGAFVKAHVKVFNGDGGLLMQSPEQLIPRGEFRSTKINRNEIPLSGEPGTNRAQVRLNPYYNPYITIDSIESARPSPVIASFEVVDNATGKTVTLSGQQCFVFYLGGTK